VAPAVVVEEHEPSDTGDGDPLPADRDVRDAVELAGPPDRPRRRVDAEDARRARVGCPGSRPRRPVRRRVRRGGGRLLVERRRRHDDEAVDDAADGQPALAAERPALVAVGPVERPDGAPRALLDVPGDGVDGTVADRHAPYVLRAVCGVGRADSLAVELGAPPERPVGGVDGRHAVGAQCRVQDVVDRVEAEDARSLERLCPLRGPPREAIGGRAHRTVGDWGGEPVCRAVRPAEVARTPGDGGERRRAEGESRSTGAHTPVLAGTRKGLVAARRRIVTGFTARTDRLLCLSARCRGARRRSTSSSRVR
jgi:hypothetical protein